MTNLGNSFDELTLQTSSCYVKFEPCEHCPHGYLPGRFLLISLKKIVAAAKHHNNM